MLKSREIHFAHHDLLTVQMLETMQQGTLEAALAPYLTYADGIVCGLTVSMDDTYRIHIAPGAVKWNRQLYMLTVEYVGLRLTDYSKGWLILQPVASSFELSFVEQLPEASFLILAAFSNRDSGSVLRQVDQLKKLRFMNYFDARAVRVAGADGQLTYNTVIAQCFAQELLSALGADAFDCAFAWQALQTPPTKTMWELYLQRNDMTWTEDGTQFVNQLFAILKNKEKPLRSAMVYAVAEVEDKPEQRGPGIRID